MGGVIIVQTFQVKRRYQLVVRLKAIKSIKELLCFLSSYINLESSDLCSPRLIGIIIMEAFGLIVDCLMRWGLSSLPSLLIWLSSVWLISKAIHFTHKLHIQVIGVAIETCYCFHKSNFHKSDLSLRQFISLINCTIDSTIHLGHNAVMTARPSSYKSRFIYHFKIAILSKKIVF